MGKLIVFEGIDGSGKSTQLHRVCTRLEREGRDFIRVAFPQYEEPSSALIKMYLGGEFGDNPDDVNAYAASSFFAVDRFASYKKVWQEYYERGGVILTDRYTTSNAIHQGAKLSQQLREDFFRWLYDYEFRLMGLPTPDMVLYMDIDATAAMTRLSRRQSETSTVGDIHEKADFLGKSAQCAKHAAQYYNWQKISCFDGERERAEDEIEKEIYDVLIGMWGAEDGT